MMDILHRRDVIVAGDTPPHALWEETQTGQIEFSRFAAETVAALIPGVPMYSCIGNHGTYRTLQFTVISSELYKNLVKT